MQLLSPLLRKLDARNRGASSRQLIKLQTYFSQHLGCELSIGIILHVRNALWGANTGGGGGKERNVCSVSSF